MVIFSLLIYTQEYTSNIKWQIFILCCFHHNQVILTIFQLCILNILTGLATLFYPKSYSTPKTCILFYHSILSKVILFVTALIGRFFFTTIINGFLGPPLIFSWVKHKTWDYMCDLGSRKHRIMCDLGSRKHGINCRLIMKTWQISVACIVALTNIYYIKPASWVLGSGHLFLVQRCQCLMHTTSLLSNIAYSLEICCPFYWINLQWCHLSFHPLSQFVEEKGK